MPLPDIVQRFDLLLEKAGFQTANPNPLLAWQVFKEFAALPMHDAAMTGEMTEIWVEYFQGPEGKFYLEFSREFHFPPKKLATLPVGCDFTHDPILELGGTYGHFYGGDFKTPQELFDTVEADAGFQLCLQQTDWNLENMDSSWDDKTETDLEA